MRDLDDVDLLHYVLGDAPQEIACAIEARAAADREFSARVGILGAGLPSAKEPSHSRRRLRRVLPRGRLLAASLLVATVLGGAAWAAWAALAPHPLFEDHFRGRGLDNEKWDPSLGRRWVSQEDGYLRLVNRGIRVTRQEFREPIEVTLDWRWRDLAGDPEYAEDFCVALRTSGKHLQKHPYEVMDGVIIKFSCRGNCVDLVSRADRSLHELSPLNGTKFPPDAWHHIRITDDGETIAVYLAGPEIEAKYATTPVVRARSHADFGDAGTPFHIAVYDRELVSEAEHESDVAHFVVGRLLRPKQQDQDPTEHIQGR
jgi:hypothetical protein